MMRWRLFPVIVLALVGCGGRVVLPEATEFDPGGGVGGADGSIGSGTDAGPGGIGSGYDGAAIVDDARGETASATDTAGSVGSGDASVIAAGCPPVLPLPGSTCSGALECAYPGCDTTHLDRATCTGGTWRVSAAACTSVCPMTMPPASSPCAIDPGYLCYWDVKCTTSAIGTCETDGRWAIKDGGCAPECTSVPVLGAPCSGGGCHFVNECGLGVHAYCDSGKWGFAGFPCSAPPPCPPVKPALGTACSTSVGYCSYENACGSMDVAFCSGGTWRMFAGRCATPGCPTTPVDGSPCSIPDGSSCNYPVGGGCAVSCACPAATKTWACTQTCP